MEEIRHDMSNMIFQRQSILDQGPMLELSIELRGYQVWAQNFFTKKETITEM